MACMGVCTATRVAAAALVVARSSVTRAPASRSPIHGQAATEPTPQGTRSSHLHDMRVRAKAEIQMRLIDGLVLSLALFEGAWVNADQDPVGDLPVAAFGDGSLLGRPTPARHLQHAHARLS